jgi:cbb3-type cytochrome oxidase maturation protein
MSVLVILILASLVVALLFLGGFIWAVRSGQYDDTCTPSMRVLTDDRAPGAAKPPAAVSSNTHTKPT